MRSDPRTGDEALRRATELDPLNSANWIRRGVRAEFAGDPEAAEKLYLEAGRVSQLFGPRAMLMNFYFRQGDQEQFWKWARAAFAVSYGNLDGTFLLCWQVAPDAKVILDRAMLKNPATLVQFLDFAVRQAGVTAARPVADGLVSQADGTSAPALLDYCEELIRAKRVADAHDIWLGLAHRGLLAGAAAGAAQNLIGDAGFQARPLQRGFGWRTISSPEVTLIPGGKPGEMGIAFSGNQPEEAEVLSQIVALPGSTWYRFSAEQRTSQHSDPGLSWEIEDLEAGRCLARLPVVESADWTSLSARFEASRTPFIRLSLRYQRQPGTVRYEGEVLIRQLRLAGAK